jgi:hypothetical protein
MVTVVVVWVDLAKAGVGVREAHLVEVLAEVAQMMVLVEHTVAVAVATEPTGLAAPAGVVR